MNPRALLISIGATALAFALVVAGIAGGPGDAAAQAATPDTGGTTAESDDRAEAYAAFVASIAAELGVADGAQVDAAIRTALKQEIDARQAAGELSVEEAAARKAVIDVTAAPLPLGFGGHGPFRGGPGGFGDGERGPRGEERGPRGEDGIPALPDAEAPAGGELSTGDAADDGTDDASTEEPEAADQQTARVTPIV